MCILSALSPQGWDDLMHLAELADSRRPAGMSAEAAVEAPQAVPQRAAEHLLASVADAVERDGAAWQAFCTLEAPENAQLPGSLSGSLSAFEQLLVRRISGSFFPRPILGQCVLSARWVQPRAYC